MKRILVLAGCTALLSFVPGCDASFNIGGPPTGGPQCPTHPEGNGDQLNSPLLLTAQSVPTAALVPCLRALPTGWTFHDMTVRKGDARVVLDFGKGGDRAATVTLSRRCDVASAIETASDQAGARRYARVLEPKPTYRAERYYLFPGGCVRYQFNLHGGTGEAQATTLSLTLDFVDRELLRRYVHELSHGRLNLDPPPERAVR